MIHILMWLSIIGTLAFFWWVYQPYRTAYRKRTFNLSEEST